jgi:TolB-like protein
MAERLNGYELGRRLGGGAEGDVFEAVDTRTGRKVALKLLRRAGPELLAALRSLQRSPSAACARVLDAFEADGKTAAVLELVGGAPLREFLGAADGAARERLARELLARVGQLHDEGLAHGDLSPGNVFVSPEGRVTLLDPRHCVAPSAGAVLGTSNYCAPEMLLFGSVPSRKADVFSLCALLYEVFEGRDAFGCSSPEEYVLKAGAKRLELRPFERTPERLRRMLAAGLSLDPAARPASVEALERLIERPARRWALAALAAALALGAAGAWRLRSASGSAASIAVLPFVNESGDPDAEYLCDGLTESLINALVQLPAVRVSPRSAAFRHKGRGVDPVAAARELGVGAVVAGRLRRRADRLVVSVELLDARQDKQLWGERYDRKAADALEVQRDIAGRIFASLRARVTAPTERRLASRRTESPEAFQAYMKGRYYWNRRSAKTIVKALEQFQKAVAADPAYALAYIGLADTYALLQQYAGVSSSEAFPKARAAARRALEIDDTLAEAHASLGYIEIMAWNFEESKRQFDRALELAPDYPTARSWHSMLLFVTGKRREALEETLRAQRLDPLSPIVANQICNFEMIEGDLDRAMEDCRKVLELDADFPRTHDLLGWALLKKGRGEEALAEVKKAAAVTGEASQELSYLGYVYGALGRRQEAGRVLKELERRHAQGKTPAMYVAAVHAGLGDKDQAFAWLEKDYRARSGLLVYITFFTNFDTLRGDPRYADLLRRMGIR